MNLLLLLGVLGGAYYGVRRVFGLDTAAGADGGVPAHAAVGADLANGWMPVDPASAPATAVLPTNAVDASMTAPKAGDLVGMAFANTVVDPVPSMYAVAEVLAVDAGGLLTVAFVRELAKNEVGKTYADPDAAATWTGVAASFATRVFTSDDLAQMYGTNYDAHCKAPLEAVTYTPVPASRALDKTLKPATAAQIAAIRPGTTAYAALVWRSGVVNGAASQPFAIEVTVVAMDPATRSVTVMRETPFPVGSPTAPVATIPAGTCWKIDPSYLGT